MKTVIQLIFWCILVALAGCQPGNDQDVSPAVSSGSSDMTTTPDQSSNGTDTTGYKLVSQGTFVSNVHTTSGTVKLYEKAEKQLLVFENFKTDSGPDLRVYLAENTGVRNFIELTRLNNTGNFTLELPNDANPNTRRFVLIWCKAFSVLFGNAELK
ncbi:DM13 domain-containing protein [Spirosoma sp. SC4-14]|uniref:DM13 domain-containing protein n=1 Tax=Spirosoma sp. SC4-14 TaxID=3128900 RepID=UPI0030CCFA69